MGPCSENCKDRPQEEKEGAPVEEEGVLDPRGAVASVTAGEIAKGVAEELSLFTSKQGVVPFRKPNPPVLKSTSSQIPLWS